MSTSLAGLIIVATTVTAPPEAVAYHDLTQCASVKIDYDTARFTATFRFDSLHCWLSSPLSVSFEVAREEDEPSTAGTVCESGEDPCRVSISLDHPDLERARYVGRYSYSGSPSSGNGSWAVSCMSLVVAAGCPWPDALDVRRES